MEPNTLRRVGEIVPGSRPRGPWRLHRWEHGDVWARLFEAPDGALYGAGLLL